MTKGNNSKTNYVMDKGDYSKLKSPCSKEMPQFKFDHDQVKFLKLT